MGHSSLKAFRLPAMHGEDAQSHAHLKLSSNASLQPARSSLIPHSLADDAHLEDDSNDEWEEDVHLDLNQVRATVQSAIHNKQSESHPANNSQHANSLKDDPSTHQLQSTATDNASTTPSSNEKKSLERRRAIRLRKRLLKRHGLHITLLIAHLLRLDTAANKSLVRALALSVTPSDVLQHEIPHHERLSRLALWIRASYPVTAMPVSFEPYPQKKLPKFSLHPNPLNRMTSFISSPTDAAVDVFDVVTLACAILRQQAIRCRLVSPLQPIPYIPPKVSRNNAPSSDNHAVVADNTTPKPNDTIMIAWIEVWNPDKKIWNVIDPFDGFVCKSNPHQEIKHATEQIPLYCHQARLNNKNIAQRKEPAKKKPVPPRRRSSRGQSQHHAVNQEALNQQGHNRTIGTSFFCHVVAVENGLVTDVTRRYTRSWSDIRQARAPGNTFTRCVEAMGRSVLSEEEQNTKLLEAKQFETLVAKDPVPTTISEVQKHPRYILERHVKKYEVLHPREPIVGFINDEPIFLRENVHLLHTKDRWIRQMRQVVEGEKALKKVKSKNGTDATVELFGKWQTQPLRIEPVVDGKVPRGEHGNVDLWTEEHLPAGGAHVNMAFAKQAARKLGVDWAPAMTGFELRRGRSVPKIEGVVVATEHSEAVQDAARELETAAKERELKRLRLAAEEQWNKLLRKMQAREKVRSKYGNADLALSYEARQKRVGERLARMEKRGEAIVEDVRNNDVNLRHESLFESEIKSHTHTFDNEKCVDGNMWVKTCSICGTEVPYEKL